MARLRVERLARGQQRGAARPSPAGAPPSAGDRPADDAVPVVLGLRAAARRCARGAAAARRSPATSTRPPPVASTIGRASASTLRERLALEPAVVLLAVQREDLAERQPGRLLDAAGRARRSGTRSRRASRRPIVVLPAPRRPSSAIDAAAPARRRPAVSRSAASCAERARQVGEPPDGDVAAPGLDVHEEAHARAPRARRARGASSRRAGGAARTRRPSVRARRAADRTCAVYRTERQTCAL